MKKESQQPNKEMTITEVGGLVLKLMDTTAQMGKELKVLDNKIDGVEARLSKKIESVEVKLTKKIDESEEFVARTANKGFINQDKEIRELREDMNNRFETMDKKFETVDTGFEEVNENIGKVRKDVWNLDERFVTRREFTLGLN